MVLEYATALLIAEASREIEQGHLDRLIELGLCQAQAKEYVRDIQEHLLVGSLLSRLLSTYQGQADLEARLLWLLDGLRGWTQPSGVWIGQSGGAVARVAGELTWSGPLASCPSRHALQGVEMQDASLSGAMLRDTMFTEAIDAIMVVTISSTGQYWVAATRQGKVRVGKRQVRPCTGSGRPTFPG